MIRWGVLGNAWIARDFMIPALEKSRNGVLAAIASRSEPPEDIAPAARHYNSYEALLCDEEIDAVYIPVPNALHMKWSIEAMRHGKHVLCEKPLVCTEEEVHRIMQVSEETGKCCMEAFMYRLNARFTLLKKVLKEQNTGKILAMQAMNGYTLDWDSPAREDRSLGGGCLYDIGCYCVDSMNDLMALQGACFEDAEATFMIKKGVDHQCAGSIRYSDGTLGSFLCWFNAPGRQTLTLACENGIVTVDDPYESGTARVRLLQGETEKVFEADAGPDPYQLEAEAFADMIAVKDPEAKDEQGKANAYKTPMISMEESLLNARVMDSLLKTRPNE